MLDLDALVSEIISDLMDENGRPDIGGKQFVDRLESYGFMIVPIEDPTNLRFGVEDD